MNKTIKYSFLVFGLQLLLHTSSVYAQTEEILIDSLESVLKTYSKTDRRLFPIYQKLINAYLVTDAEKSLKYAQMGIRLGEQTNDLYQIAEFYYKAGNSFYFMNQLDSALHSFEKSQEIHKLSEAKGMEDKEKTDYLRLRLFESIAQINQNRGKYDVALKGYLQALAVTEKINDPEEMTTIYDNLATTYQAMSNFTQSETYYLMEEKLCRELNDSAGMVNAWFGLCRIQHKRNDYSKALKYGEDAYRYFSTHAHMLQDYKLADAAQCLSEIWLYIPDYDKALEYARIAVQHAFQINLSSYKVSTLYTLSTVYLKQGKYKECEQTAFQALNVDSSVVYLNTVLYGNILQANILLENKKKSIEYLSKTLNAHRAYANAGFQSSLSEMEVKYETEKKEMQITTLEEEKRLILWLSIAGITMLLLGLAALFFLWRWTVQKKRLTEKRRQLAEQQVIQLEQEKQLVATQAVLDGETQERTRLARDLHDGLGSMLTGVKLNLESMKNGALLEQADTECFDKAMKILDDSMRELRRVAHHLMPESLSRYGLKPAIGDFCRSLSSNIVFDWFGSEDRLDPKLEVVIYRIIHELVNNALKYANASQVMVQVMQETDRIALTVQDDGCGFNPATVNRGMGLSNIRTRVASFGGNMQIHSKTGEGTEISIEWRMKQDKII